MDTQCYTYSWIHLTGRLRCGIVFKSRWLVSWFGSHLLHSATRNDTRDTHIYTYTHTHTIYNYGITDRTAYANVSNINYCAALTSKRFPFFFLSFSMRKIPYGMHEGWQWADWYWRSGCEFLPAWGPTWPRIYMVECGWWGSVWIHGGIVVVVSACVNVCSLVWWPQNGFCFLFSRHH